MFDEKYLNEILEANKPQPTRIGEAGKDVFLGRARNEVSFSIK
jgi:hypothetical protein